MTDSLREIGSSGLESANRPGLELLESTTLGPPPVVRDQLSFDLYIDLTGREPRVEVGDAVSFQHRLQTAPRWQLAVKRGVDLVGALAALILLSPLLLLTALAVATTSRGPVFFAQERVGYMGERFRFLKFRSMCHDAEAQREGLLEHNHHESGPVFKIREDPRMTPVGRFIRRFSIDETPQFFHVLTGRMSLVGPRPPLPEEVETYGPRELLRLSVKPGITCIWQVSGRSDLDFDTWVEMDVEYLESWCLWLDVRLLARTVPAVLSGRGAY